MSGTLETGTSKGNKSRKPSRNGRKKNTIARDTRERNGGEKKSSARKSPTSGGGRNGTALYTAVTGLALRATAVPPWRADVFGQRTGNRGYHGTGNVESRSAVGTVVKRMVFAFLPSAPLLETNSKKKFKTIKSSTVRTSAGAMVLFFIATTYATQGCFVLFHFFFLFFVFFLSH